jgi:hypothetical protein
MVIFFFTIAIENWLGKGYEKFHNLQFFYVKSVASILELNFPSKLYKNKTDTTTKIGRGLRFWSYYRYKVEGYLWVLNPFSPNGSIKNHQKWTSSETNFSKVISQIDTNSNFP